MARRRSTRSSSASSILSGGARRCWWIGSRGRRERRRPRSPIPRWALGAPRSPPAPRRRAKIPIASVLGSVQSRFAEVLARQRAGPPARSTLARPQQTSTDYADAPDDVPEISSRQRRYGRVLVDSVFERSAMLARGHDL